MRPFPRMTDVLIRDLRSGGARRTRLRRLGLSEFCEHTSRIDSDERSGTACQDFALVADDLGDVHKLTPRHALRSANDGELLAERYWLEVFHVHRAGQGQDVAEFVHLAHGFIQDRGDDSTMSMSWRSLVAAGELELADSLARRLVEKKLQLHACRVIFAADKTSVPARFHRWVRSVSVRNFILGHGRRRRF